MTKQGATFLFFKMDLKLGRKLSIFEMYLGVQPAPCSPELLEQRADGSNSIYWCVFMRSLLILGSVSAMVKDFVFSESLGTMPPQQHLSVRSRDSVHSSCLLPCGLLSCTVTLMYCNSAQDELYQNTTAGPDSSQTKASPLPLLPWWSWHQLSSTVFSSARWYIDC